MISLIGGAGFIGTRLAHRLRHSEKAFDILDIATSPDFPKETTRVDIRSMDALRKAVPEGSLLINLAAVHRDDVRPISLYDEVNVEGSRNICQVAREKKCETIVFTSSVAVYGFAPPGTREDGEIRYFNDYGRTKWLAEKVYREWQQEDPENRTLVIVRPTVVFGEQNRGNVYNLLHQIASGKFMMVGSGRNIKSMAYVENVAAFLEFASTHFKPGIHTYNYIDKPDFDMNSLVSSVRGILGMSKGEGIHLPYALGWLAGFFFDVLSRVTGKPYTVSSIRIKKFCATTRFDSSVSETGFVPEVPMEKGLEKTVRYEFIEDNTDKPIFHTE
ncbi:NAD-dependent epimerase/dehydratase family protein [Balneolales bacterium ANBcel1]|nr:NAD-dependent epimerase/dehydratase family protein [Balneolales bacterium ANBcel1]